MGSRTSLPHLTHLERMQFCKNGTLPSRVMVKTIKEPLIQILLYEAHCPCGENDPHWIVTARHLYLQKKGRPFFPNLFKKYGAQRYDEAMEALVAYRKVKAFHKTWLALTKATNDASLGLSRHGVDLVVELSESGWKEFMTHLTNEVVGHLKGKIESAIQDHAKSKMSSRAQLRFDKAMAYLDRIGMLHTIWKGVKAKELAKKKHDDPEVFDYKLRFFIGLMAKGERYLKLYKQYSTYNKAYWRLLEHSGREIELRSGKKGGGNDWNPRSTDRSFQFLPADNGLY